MLLGVLLKLGLIRRVNLCNVGHQRIIRVGLLQQRHQRLQHLANACCWLPLVVLQQGNADGALLINVGVVHLGQELDLWRLEGIVGGEYNIQLEDAALVRGVGRSGDLASPVEDVALVNRPDGDAIDGVLVKVKELGLESAKSHCDVSVCG